MILDYESRANACKRKYLRNKEGNLVKKYHYLFFIATDFHARGQGLASQVVARYQVEACKDGLPIWLEASSERSRSVYAKQGFELMQEITLGKGTHGANGAHKKGGPGVKIWAMCWWPSVKDQK